MLRKGSFFVNSVLQCLSDLTYTFIRKQTVALHIHSEF